MAQPKNMSTRSFLPILFDSHENEITVNRKPFGLEKESCYGIRATCLRLEKIVFDLLNADGKQQQRQL